MQRIHNNSYYLLKFLFHCLSFHFLCFTKMLGGLGVFVFLLNLKEMLKSKAERLLRAVLPLL